MPGFTTHTVSPGDSSIPQLYVNDGALEASQVGLLTPTDPRTTSMEDMRRSLGNNGYLFLKGMLPREDVLEARRNYFEHLRSTGLLKPGTEPVQGIFDSSRDPADYPGVGTGSAGTDTEVSAKFQELALSAHGEAWYKDIFCKHPALLNFVSELTGWKDNTMSIERTLLRNNIPTNRAIGVHYDFIFLRHGADSVLTAWVPMGDIKINGGGLIYVEKGHELGKKIESDFKAKAMSAGMTEEESRNAFNQNMMSGGVLSPNPRQFAQEESKKWLVTAYEAGDVVLHTSYAIHASTINHDEDGVIRLGTDLRFVDKSGDWDTRWQKVYELDDGL